MGLITLAPEVLSVFQKSKPEEEYSEVFQGLGRMEEKYKIRLSQDTGYSLTPKQGMLK